jgi:hypothetical protein
MKNLLLIPLLISFASCTKTEVAVVDAKSTDAPAAAVVSVEITEADHPVICGCKIESVGSCGNYIEFDGEYAEITNSADVGLGGMQWCGSSDDHATITGTRTGDKFEAKMVTLAE